MRIVTTTAIQNYIKNHPDTGVPSQRLVKKLITVLTIDVIRLVSTREEQAEANHQNHHKPLNQTT